MLIEKRGGSQKAPREHQQAVEGSDLESVMSDVWKEGIINLVKSSRKISRMRNEKCLLDLFIRKSYGNILEPFQ